jgi:hypothetical protein
MDILAPCWAKYGNVEAWEPNRLESLVFLVTTRFVPSPASLQPLSNLEKSLS